MALANTNVSLNCFMALEERKKCTAFTSHPKLSTCVMLQSLFSEIYPRSLAAPINSRRNYMVTEKRMSLQ